MKTSDSLAWFRALRRLTRSSLLKMMFAEVSASFINGTINDNITQLLTLWWALNLGRGMSSYVPLQVIRPDLLLTHWAADHSMLAMMVVKFLLLKFILRLHMKV